MLYIELSFQVQVLQPLLLLPIIAPISLANYSIPINNEKMKIKNWIYLFIAFLVQAGEIRAQIFGSALLGGNGSTSFVGGIQLDWTAGEVATATFTSNEGGKTILTQGFEQPELQVWTGDIGTLICPGSMVLVPVLA